jgi:Ni/Fe-hydrogenase subunit HybB-like protein
VSEQRANETLGGLRTKGLIVGAVGLAACGAAWAMDAERFYQAYLPGYLFWLAASLGCLGWTMIHHLTEGKWGFPVRRIWEAGGRTIYLMVPLFIPVFLGMHALFPWTLPEAANDPILVGKSGYLNVSFFLLRAGLYFVIWCGFAFLLSSWSTQQDGEEVEPMRTRMRKLSGAGILTMAITVTFMSVDWAMSVDPHWFSTIFGFLFAVSDLLMAMAITIIVTKLLWDYEPFHKAVKTNTFHDLGNLLMAFTMLWGYIAFSQFLIIWSGNTQEEAPWYIARNTNGWNIVTVILIVFHFAVPFLVLLTRKTKRAPSMLVKVAAWMIVMRYIDLYWLIMPSFGHGGEAGFHPSWIDLAVPIGLGGVWFGFFAMQLMSRNLAPLADPRFQEALADTGGHH